MVSIKELTTDNLAFCLSPLRVFEECNLCQVYKNAERHNRLDKLKCKPHIKKGYLELMKRKKELLKQVDDINEQIKQL